MEQLQLLSPSSTYVYRIRCSEARIEFERMQKRRGASTMQFVPRGPGFRWILLAVSHILGFCVASLLWLLGLIENFGARGAAQCEHLGLKCFIFYLHASGFLGCFWKTCCVHVEVSCKWRVLFREEGRNIFRSMCNISFSTLYIISVVCWENHSSPFLNRVLLFVFIHSQQSPFP